MDQKQLLAAAEAAERVANAQTPEEQRIADMAMMRHTEALKIGLMYAQLNQVSETPHVTECLPVRDEGDDIGVIEARIPAELFYRLCQQKNFGQEGFYSAEGIRDIQKAHPFTKVKTVSGKLQFSGADLVGG
jgi:hypothetical protein